MSRQGIKCFSIDEVKVLLNYLVDKKSLEREFFLVNLTLQTGLRIAEIYNLNVGDVIDKKRLEIVGKGQKRRTVPLNADIRRHIVQFLKWKRKQSENLDPNSPLFVSRNHQRWSMRAIQRAFDKVLKNSGITTHYSFHCLRHTFATLAYRADGNIRTVQELLGHSRLDTTMVYTYVNDEDKQEAVEKLASVYKQ